MCDAPRVLTALTIDPALRETASEARQLEWDGAIREMLAPGEAVVDDALHSLHVSMSEQGFQFRATDEDGAVFAELTLGHDVLATSITEYVDCVRQIALAAGNLPRLEALDMAKKATHDNAGRKLQRKLRPLGMDHPTARRLFTLLLCLKVDTTRLMGVHGHRRIR